MAARTIDDRYRPFSGRLHRHLRRLLGSTALGATVVLGGGCVDIEVRGAPGDQGVASCADVDAVLLVQQQLGSTDWRCEGTRYLEFESAEVVGEAGGDCIVRSTWTDASRPGSPCDPVAPPLPGTAVEGRPLVVEGQARVAELRPGRAWGIRVAVDLSGLSAEQRGRLGERWRRAASYEHASVASFARFALDLMAHGAPPALLVGAQRAGAQEIRHAQLCFGLAAAYAPEVEPGRLALPGHTLRLSEDLATLAVDTAREGAIGETMAAIRAAEQLRRATDPGVRAVLSELVRDEADHAELAWRTLRWAIDQGGEPVRRALRPVFDDAARAADGFFDGGPADAALVAHGLLSDDLTRRALRGALAEVILPAAQELLASPSARPRAVVQGAAAV